MRRMAMAVRDTVARAVGSLLSAAPMRRPLEGLGKLVGRLLPNLQHLAVSPEIEADLERLSGELRIGAAEYAANISRVMALLERLHRTLPFDVGDIRQAVIDLERSNREGYRSVSDMLGKMSRFLRGVRSQYAALFERLQSDADEAYELQAEALKRARHRISDLAKADDRTFDRFSRWGAAYAAAISQIVDKGYRIELDHRISDEDLLVILRVPISRSLMDDGIEMARRQMAIHDLVAMIEPEAVGRFTIEFYVPNEHA
jgi:hypothetical protein